MIVWLWDVPGPTRCGCGISDDEGRAREAAEAYLQNGRAGAARVEEAWAILGIPTLTSGYERTGQGWRARLQGGRISWEPLRQLAAL
jgi:hypothetical protein